MKIQNTEMEFVSFDAQDVIATSTTGGPGTPLGYFAGSVKNGVGGITFNESGEFFNLGTVDDIEYYIDKSGLQSSTYYIINSSTYYDDEGINYVLDATGSESRPSGSEYKSLDTAGDILTWLMGIATVQ